MKKKYWVSGSINLSFDIGLYDEDYIEAESEEEAERIARQKVLSGDFVDTIDYTDNDIEIYCVSEIEEK